KKLSLYLGLLFSAFGTAVLLLSKDILMAAIWLSFGNGLLLSQVRLTKPNPVTGVMPAQNPAVKYVSRFLIGLAVVLLIFQVYSDVTGAAGEETAKEQQVK
ncbi:MAG: hypothetical protein LPK19_11015, partial [Hymenobacteraceae bacterium]|nr:hypothetical protein [Hymenobacteraceae bacterium]MDX5396764.1 hypothetical protein [Hymenobacteraceae bacterium]MDX5512826.1 hypothetical protein [Hymenobacteraceae bacterium]